MKKVIGLRLFHLPSADWDARQIAHSLIGRARADAVRRLECEASDALGVDVVAFGAARVALAASLVTAPGNIGRVLIPAYTCVAVPNAVATAGIGIEWTDIEGANLNVDVALQHLRPGDAVIAQHTYGVPFRPGQLRRLRQSRAFVVEDRAHRFDGSDLEGDVAIFSLEHSKVVSAGQGGLVWARDPQQREALRQLQQRLPEPPTEAARRALRTSAVQAAIYRLGGGPNSVSSLMRRVALRVPPLSTPGQTVDELNGGMVAMYALHPALASAGIASIRRHVSNLEHRRRMAAVYRSVLGSLIPAWAAEDRPYVRQPVLVDDAERSSRLLRQKGIDLGIRWFNAPVHPLGSLSTYQSGSAPVAERLVSQVLTLPTHLGISVADAQMLAKQVADAAS